MLSSEEREGTMKIGIIGLGKVGSAFLKACAVTAALQVVSVKAGRSPWGSTAAVCIHCRALPEAALDLKISAWLLMVIMKHSKLPVIWPKRFRHIHSEFLKRSAVPIMRLLVFVLIIL